MIIHIVVEERILKAAQIRCIQEDLVLSDVITELLCEWVAANKRESDELPGKQSFPSTPAAIIRAAGAKRLSHLQLGPALLVQGATEEQIKAAFTASFNFRGVTDQDWIDKRIAIYMRIARKKLKKG
jgi:hypothetical protein